MVAAPALMVPPLESGDRLSDDEFWRRYEAEPGTKKAELIEGVVYVASPVSAEYHGDREYDMSSWFSAYTTTHPGVRGSHNSTIRLATGNIPQPDLSLRYTGGSRGTTRMVSGYIEGPPELVVEIAASSASYDLHAKKDAYRRYGVQEYIAWRVYDRAIDWFELREGAYIALAPNAAGIIESRVFPGLRLAVAAMLAGDMPAVLAAQSGAASPRKKREG